MLCVLLGLHRHRPSGRASPRRLWTCGPPAGKTWLLLDDAETGVIGSLMLSDVNRSETGIPLLRELPLIGGLFRTTRQTERKQDLIILVTPRIVSPQGGDTPMTGGALKSGS